MSKPLLVIVASAPTTAELRRRRVHVHSITQHARSVTLRAHDSAESMLHAINMVEEEISRLQREIAERLRETLHQRRPRDLRFRARGLQERRPVLGETQAQTLKTVGELVDENPKQAALIVRDWLSSAA